MDSSKRKHHIPRSSSTQDLGSLEHKSSAKSLTRSSSSVNITLDSEFTRKNVTYKYSIFSVIEEKVKRYIFFIDYF